MAINERASSDARHARTGKDAGLYNGTGDLLASMESFQAKATYNNVKYKPMGDPQEHETSDSCYAERKVSASARGKGPDNADGKAGNNLCKKSDVKSVEGYA